MDLVNFQPLAFGVCAAVTVGMQLSFFAIAFSLKIDKVTDLAGCANFVVLALLTILWRPEVTSPRQVVLTTLVCVSRVQLGSFLLYRVLKRGHDARFDEMRSKFFPFLGFWIYQMLWVYVVSAPLIYVNSTWIPQPEPPLGAADWIGWVGFVLGFAIQLSADLQKSSFRSDPSNAKRVCTIGLWRFSRHPNFAGEVMMWWAVYICGIPFFIHSPAGFATCVSPLFTMAVLLGLSGIPTAEGANAKRWYDGGEAEAAYTAYFQTTPPLWLFPPGLYRGLPVWAKRLLCFELPSYEYRPSAESSQYQPPTSSPTEAEATVLH